MKRISFLLCALILVSLACLASEFSAIEKPMSPTSTVVKVGSNLKELSGAVCARVIAETAQNLREGASPSSRILGHLANGDQVKVIRQIDSRWWLVQEGERLGYARSSYLEIVDCETEKP